MRTLFALLLLILAGLLYVAATEEPPRPEPELQSVGWLDQSGQPIRPARYRHR